MKQIKTRFRAYQLGNAGSSFSYFADNHFTLIEARLTDINKITLDSELAVCGKSTIDILHITSWDQDHCSVQQLQTILEVYTPIKIEYPGYPPHTDSGKDSLKVIKQYLSTHKSKLNIKIQSISPSYIKSLDIAKELGYNNVLHHPKFLSESSNDNSTIKHFRKGSFNLLSLGDVESTMISSRLARKKTIQKETDVMILAHHGADNGFTTSNFLKKTKPLIAIATSNYDNQFSHPKQNIRDLLYKFEIDLFTTKTGDIIIESINKHNGHFRVINLIAGSTKVSSTKYYKSRKNTRLNVNGDTLRARKMKRIFPK